MLKCNITKLYAYKKHLTFGHNYVACQPNNIECWHNYIECWHKEVAKQHVNIIMLMLTEFFLHKGAEVCLHNTEFGSEEKNIQNIEYSNFK